MLIYSNTGPLYPITVTEIHVNKDGEVDRSGKLFTYFYKIVVTESTRYGTEKDVLKKVYVPFSSEIAGTLKEWKIERGTVIRGPGVPIAEIEEPCKHEVQFGGICTECGKDMTEMNYANSKKDTDRATINLNHRNPALKVSVDEAQRVSSEVKRRLVKSKKLSLVVDLDQTIIHATVDPTVAEWRSDKYNPNYEAVKDVRSFQLADEGPGVRSCWYHIKLRPGLTEFLQQMAQIYELHVYTMGTRAYADQIMKLVDPERTLFGDRVLSRDESGSMSAKDLRRLFPVDDSMVVIIDDRGDVWNWDSHLVKVHAYNFFVGIGDINSSFLPKRPEERAAKKPENLLPTSDTGTTDKTAPDIEETGENSQPVEANYEEEVIIEPSLPATEVPADVPAEVAAEVAAEALIEAPVQATNEATHTSDDPSHSESPINGDMDMGDRPAVQNGEANEDDEPMHLELVSSLNQALSKMGTQDTALLQEQTIEQDEQIASQLADRPLLQKQMQLDKIDEEAAHRENGTTEIDEGQAPKQRHNLLHDDDTELDFLGKNLELIHQTFYDEYQRNTAPPLPDGRVAQLRGDKGTKPLFNDEDDRVPNIEVILSRMKQQVLNGVVIVFSGVIPRGVPIREFEIAIWATSFGAEINEDVSKRTTHLVAARKGTNKIHEARRRRRVKIVTTHWLHDSLTRFERMNEEDYLLLAPEEKTHAVLDSNTLLFDEQNDVSSTEETGFEAGEELDTTDIDDETEDYMSETTDENKGVDISEDNWQGMQDELADFLGSEVEDDSDAGESDAGADNEKPKQHKRKRNGDSGVQSDAEDSDASQASATGSKLQRRKRRAYERVTSLTNAITVDDVGLPSPEATGAEESKDKSQDRAGGEGNEDDDGFDEAFREALEEAS